MQLVPQKGIQDRLGERKCGVPRVLVLQEGIKGRSVEQTVDSSVPRNLEETAEAIQLQRFWRKSYMVVESLIADITARIGASERRRIILDSCRSWPELWASCVPSLLVSFKQSEARGRNKPFKILCSASRNRRTFENCRCSDSRRWLTCSGGRESCPSWHCASCIADVQWSTC